MKLRDRKWYIKKGQTMIKLFYKLFGRPLTVSEIETLSFLSHSDCLLLWHQEYVHHAYRWITPETYALANSEAIKKKEICKETISPNMLADIKELLKRRLLKKRKLKKHTVSNYLTGYGQLFQYEIKVC